MRPEDLAWGLQMQGFLPRRQGEGLEVEDSAGA